jgi:leucyl aminopeptidase
MKSEFQEKHFTEVKSDAAVVVFCKEDVDGLRNTKGFANLPFGRENEHVKSAITASEFQGESGQQLMVFGLSYTRALVLIGLGQKDSITNEKLRRAAASGTKAIQSVFGNSNRKKNLKVVYSTSSTIIERLTGYEAVHSILEGALLSAYRYKKYLTVNNKSAEIDSFVVAFKELQTSIGRKAAQNARLVCDAVYFARDLANAPANEIYPETLADAATKMARKYRIKSTVFDERKIRTLRMGGLLAVSAGSSRAPRFIILEYKGNPHSKDTYVIVGKGITFDSGGISIKPSAGMAEMKMDMSGAAAVLGTLQAVASLKLPVNVVGLAPCTENLPSGSAYKPGDIVTTMSGLTIEVDNTDAEGRIILSDALYFAHRFNPKAIIDLATLTGAVVVALGHHATGMFGTSEEIMAQLREAGERTYERVWPLPLFEEYEKQIKSDVADVKNVGGKWAGSITAAAFLKKFTGNFPWVHLDIAGTAMLEEEMDYSPKGGSGVGVRLLTQFFKQIAS